MLSFSEQILRTFPSTAAFFLFEFHHGASHLSEALSELCVGFKGLIDLCEVLMSEVDVGGEKDLSDLVGRASQLENGVGEIFDQAVDGTVVRFIEAEAGDLEAEFVEAAALLDVKTDLVELANGLEDLDDFARHDVPVKINEGPVCVLI